MEKQAKPQLMRCFGDLHTLYLLPWLFGMHGSGRSRKLETFPYLTQLK